PKSPSVARTGDKAADANDSRRIAPDSPPDRPARQPEAPQTLSTSFTAGTLADSSGFPPDTMGVIGPTQYLLGVNGRIRVFDRTGAVGALDANSDVFFSSVMTPPIFLNFTTDPRVRYDRFTNRFIVIMIDVPPSQTNNRVMIAVSDPGPITGTS